MSDLRAIADRVEIEALRGEFTDAAPLSPGTRIPVQCTQGRHVHGRRSARVEERLQAVHRCVRHTEYDGTRPAKLIAKHILRISGARRDPLRSCER